MSSQQQRIMTQAVARMKLISGTGGYSTNVNNHVEDSRTNWDEDELLPAISIFDADVTAQPVADNEPFAIVLQPLLIKGFVKQGSDASNARALIADIYTAIRVDTQWKETGTPLVAQTRMVRHSVNRNPDSFEVEGCEVEIELMYLVQKFTN